MGLQGDLADARAVLLGVAAVLAAADALHRVGAAVGGRRGATLGSHGTLRSCCASRWRAGPVPR